MGRGTGLDLVLLIPGREPKVGLFDEGLGEVTGREGSEDTGLTARVGLITLMTFLSKDRLESSDRLITLDSSPSSHLKRRSVNKSETSTPLTSSLYNISTSLSTACPPEI